VLCGKGGGLDIVILCEMYSGKVTMRSRGGGTLDSPPSITRHTKKTEQMSYYAIYRGRCLTSSSQAFDASTLGGLDATTCNQAPGMEQSCDIRRSEPSVTCVVMLIKKIICKRSFLSYFDEKPTRTGRNSCSEAWKTRKRVKKANSRGGAWA